MTRRLAAIPLLLLLAMMAALAAAATTTTRTVADDFSSGGYSGSSGSHAWNSNWSEIGESNGSGSGSVKVASPSRCSGSCLQIAALLSLGPDLGASRQVDVAEAIGAVLEYDVHFPGGLLVSGQALVEASADGGGWVRLAAHDAGTDNHFTRDLPAGEVVTIRFITAGLSLGSTLNVDSVLVTIDYPEPTTTTTTTTTTDPPSPVTTRPPSTTTTTNPDPGSDPPSTTTTRPSTSPPTTRPSPGGEPEATTTTTPSTTTTAAVPPGDTPSTTTPSDEPPLPGPGDPPQAEPPLAPPSQTFGVITGVDPGLAPADLRVTAQRGFVVAYLLSSEHISLDIVANIILGSLLAWLSTKGLDRRPS